MCSSEFFARKLACNCKRCIDNELIARAAAYIAAHIRANIALCENFLPLNEINGSYQHSWSTKTALQCMVVPESLLNGVKLLCCESFDSCDGGSIALNREHETRSHDPSINLYSACPADAMFTTDVRAGEAKVVTQKVSQIFSNANPALLRSSVYVDRDSSKQALVVSLFF
jgi:hypothetical protein